MKSKNEQKTWTGKMNSLMRRAMHIGDSPLRELKYGALPTFADVLRVIGGIAALMVDGSNPRGRQRPLGETRIGP
ncbi:MAG TPA: hypothetical protein VHX86_14385 [Tepidisphaeraceae bacterium]|jgi:hypothetical protein|nr:hypothetical protein [Tepidisphaeraceae bacterium]